MTFTLGSGIRGISLLVGLKGSPIVGVFISGGFAHGNARGSERLRGISGGWEVRIEARHQMSRRVRVDFPTAGDHGSRARIEQRMYETVRIGEAFVLTDGGQAGG